MSAPVFGDQLTVEDAIAAAEAELQEAYARLDASDRSGWETSVILTAIRFCADQGGAFSANDVRPLLPEVNTNRIGRCFALARELGEIVPVGAVKSSDRGTHGKPVARWRKAPEVTP